MLIALLIIILLVVYYIFGMDYMKQRKENAVLASRLIDITQALVQMPESPQDLEQRLADAEAGLVTRQSAFPDKLNSTQVVNVILRLADDYGVKAIPLVTQPWSIEEVGEHGYYVFRLNVAVTGGFSQMVDFVGGLEKGQFETLIVEDLNVARLSERTEEEGVPEDIIPITASLNLAVYTRSPSSD